MAPFFETFLNLEIMSAAFPAIASGARITLQLSAMIILTGITVGLFLAVARASRVPIVSTLIVAFVDIFRALPPLVVLVLAFFALPYADINLSGFVSAWLGLSAVLAAFAEEIFWAGIVSVDKGQWEAARSTGLGFAATLRLVVLPQAVRLTIAPLTNRAIAISKGTALASVLAVPEILNQATNAQAQTANPSPLTLAAITYLVLFLPLVVLSRYLESRYQWKR